MNTLAAPVPATSNWTEVCAFDELIPGLPTGALVAGQQVAVVRLRDGSVHALANWDPVAKAMVLARGIVGDLKGEPMLVSPIYKQRYSLLTGQCLDDPALCISRHPVRVVDGRVHVASWVG